MFLTIYGAKCDILIVNVLMKTLIINNWAACI